MRRAGKRREAPGSAEPSRTAPRHAAPRRATPFLLRFSPVHPSIAHILFLSLRLPTSFARATRSSQSLAAPYTRIEVVDIVLRSVSKLRENDRLASRIVWLVSPVVFYPRLFIPFKDFLSPNYILCAALLRLRNAYIMRSTRGSQGNQVTMKRVYANVSRVY